MIFKMSLIIKKRTKCLEIKCCSLILSLLLLLFTGCRTATNEKENVSIEETKRKENDIWGEEEKKVVTPNREAFAPFYEKFCADTAFQYSRILFPIPAKDFQIGDTVYKYWDEKNWIFHTTLKLYQKKQDSLISSAADSIKWSERTDSTNDTRVYLIRGVEGSCARMVLKFRLYEKKYYLLDFRIITW